jgi:hypothetical protein
MKLTYYEHTNAMQKINDIPTYLGPEMHKYQVLSDIM